MARLPQNLTSSLNQIAKAAVGRDWQMYSILLQNWREIVGADWAERATPVKLVFPAMSQRSGGTLTVSLPRGLTMAAQYQQPQMLARINGFFGHDSIARIVFIHATKSKPLPTPPPSPLSAAQQQAIVQAAAQIDDPLLRESLESFGASLISATQRPPK